LRKENKMKELNAYCQFVPSEKLSFLWMDGQFEVDEEKKKLLDFVSKETTGENIDWEKLTEKVRKSFFEETGKKIYSIFIFASRKGQKENGGRKTYCSRNNRFTTNINKDIRFYFDLDPEKDSSEFISALYEEFIAFLSTNEFSSDVIRVYLENGRIAVERLIDFPVLDVEALLKNADGWEIS